MTTSILKILENPTITELYREMGIPHYTDGDSALVPVTCETTTQWSRQEEIGTVGTYLVDGRLQVEGNPRVRPYYARGRQSRPGILEQNYRSEPVIFNSVNSITSLIKSATYEPGADGPLDPDMASITRRAHRKIMGIEGGFNRFLGNAATSVKIGFAPFEQVWDGGWIAALQFREQSTVDRWLYDHRGQQLVGAEFSVSGDVTRNYYLPYGHTVDTARLGVVTVHGSGNNIEGVSPVRVATGLRALKELLLNVAGLSYQKYGVPIIQVITDLIALNAAALAGQGESAAEIQMLLDRIDHLSASMAPALRVPAGSKIEVTSPTNTMPDIRPLLEYLDALMALCFANEGSVLGTGSFGSYALASVADDRFMRSAPVYAEAICDYLTDLLHLQIRFNHPDLSVVEVWPRYNFRFSGTQDASRWVTDMIQLVNGQVWTWPTEARHHASITMGFGETAFDDWVTPPSPDISGQQGLSPENPSENPPENTAIMGGEIE